MVYANISSFVSKNEPVARCEETFSCVDNKCLVEGMLLNDSKILF